MLINTITLLEALKAHLQGLCMPNAQEQKVFDFVDFYNEKDVDGGLTKLIKPTAKRVCLIVPGGDDYEQDNDTPFNVIFLKRTTDFSLLIADNSYKPGAVEAIFGGEKTTGAINIKDIVVRELTGKQLGFPEVSLQPMSGSLLEIGGKEGSRPCWIQSFTTPAGTEEFIVQ
jgi:hypothetical protein